MRWQTGLADSGGEAIYYEVTGSGDAPVLLLGHGAGGSHAAWFQQVPFFAAAGWRVVTWDTRGFGNSTFRTGEFGPVAAVGDITAVLDATATESAVVVGQSMGGWWAAAFALAAPLRCRALVLANTVGGLWTPALEQHFASLATAAPRDADTDGDEIGAHPALGPQLRDRDPARAFLYQQLNTLHDPPMAAMVNALVGTRHDAAMLRAAPFPKLWITSSHDQLFPAALVQEPASTIGAQLIEIADAGHSPYFEQPAAWNEALATFLDDV